MSLALALLALSAVALPSAAQDQTFPVTIVAGNCNSDTVVAELSELVLPGGNPIGAADGRTAASSFTQVPVSFDQLTGSAHAIRAGENCGPIGGSINSTGALIVVLSSDDGVGGIAYLGPNPAGQTDVSVFLAPPVSGGTDIAQVSTEATTEEVTEEPTSVPEPTPTPEPDPLGRSLDNPAPIGTLLEFEGLAVSIDSAYYDFGFGNAIPRGGYKVLIMQVTLTNTGDTAKSYAAASFSGTDADTGAGYDAVTLENVGVLLDDDSLDPGEYVSGTVLLEVQETAARVIVKYDPQMFDPNDLYWIVQ
jgi:hypothetical protein